MKTFLTIGLSVATLATFAQYPEAVKLTDREQFERATTAFKAILEASPNNGEAWFYLGENYYANDRTDSAALAYRRGIEVNPSFPLNYAGWGKVLRGEGKNAEAQAQFDKATEMANLKTNKFSKVQQGAAYREVAEGLLAGEHPDFSAALPLFDQAINLNPKDAKAYILRGDALFQRNPRDGSAPLENYKKAMELEPLAALPVARKGFMYYRAQNFPVSIEEYSNAIKLDPMFAPAYRGRAEAYFKNREFDKATADMKKYLELNVGNTSARVRNAQFLFLVEKYDESLQEIQALEQEGVKNMTLKRLKAFDLFEKGDVAAADVALKAYFAEQPADKVISVDHEYAAKISQGLAKQAKEAGQASAPLDSLAGELYLKAAGMEASKDYLYLEAAKAFTDAGLPVRAVDAMRIKVKSPRPEVNDWYYLGSMANRARMYQTADSAWAMYITKQPNIYQGYLYRARALAGLDTADVKTWSAKPFYEEVIRKMKPAEVDRAKADLEEAYNYMGLYALYNTDGPDRTLAKCWFLKVSALNAGTSITKQVNDVFLKMKELKDLPPAEQCELGDLPK
ncbi:MAG TPA: tetratricopeptide repeat protein [Flavobacteriales bacterium]|nr:tetratricopeptide repeat protein [Flavobacteriales bacterium]